MKLLLCLFLIVPPILGDNNGGCQLDREVDLSDIGATIYDNEIDALIFNVTYEGTFSVSSCFMEDHTYDGFINYTIDNKKLYIKTTEKMRHFDEVSAKRTQKQIGIKFNCDVMCKTLTTLNATITVYDYNQHPPTFQKKEYTLKVPLPLTTSVETTFENAIAVTDIDFSNQDIDFTIEPDDFVVSSVKTSDSKSYTAKFKVNRFIQFSGQRNYTITATDQGETPSPLATTAVLILEQDKSESADIPAFEFASYSFNYMVEENEFRLKPVGGQNIKLITNKPEDVTKDSIEISGDLEKYLKATFDNDTHIITLSTEQISSKSSFLMSTLTATTDGTSKAVTTIIVYMPEVEFNKDTSTYKANYNASDKSITLVGDLQISSKFGEPYVTLLGDYANYFEITRKVGTEEWSINTKPGIDDSKFSNLPYIIVTISASISNRTVKRDLIINLNSKIIEFTKVIYEANYNTKSSEVVVDYPIKLQNSVDATIEVTGGYSDYFTDTYESGLVTIKVDKPLPEEILQKENEILLTITATHEEQNAWTTCALIISIPESSKAPIFKHLFYEIEYPEDAAVGDTIPFDKPLNFTNINDPSTLLIQVKGYENYFNLEENSGEWTITIKKLLTKAESPIKATMTAKRSESNTEGTTVLFIQTKNGVNLPPEFTKASYQARYIKNDTGEFMEGDNIGLLKKDIDLTKIYLQVDKDYQDNFKFNFDPTLKMWTIELWKPLSEDVLDNEKQLILTLTATEKGNNNEGKSAVIVSLPKGEGIPPTFSRNSYEAEYINLDNNCSIKMYDHNVISVTNGDAEVSMNYTELDINQFLDIQLQSDCYEVSVRNPLPAVVLKKTSIPISLIAKKDGLESYATLILYMPLKVKDRTIEFSSVLYSGEYNAKDQQISIGNIQVKTNEEDENVNCKVEGSTYSRYLSVSYAKKTLHIVVNLPIPESEIKGMSSIYFTVSASVKGSLDQASTVIKLDIKGLDSDSENDTVYIIVICILALLLAILASAAVVFYIRKIRNRSYTNLDETETKVTFDKSVKDSVTPRKKSSMVDRRPTGFVFNSMPVEDDVDSVTKLPIPETESEVKDPVEQTDNSFTEARNRKKSVVFDDNVEKLQIEPNHEDGSSSSRKNSDNLVVLENENNNDKSIENNLI